MSYKAEFIIRCIVQVIAAYFPQLVELHNYPAANSLKQKIYNHETLNSRVLKKLGFTIPRSTIEDIVNCKAGIIETVLNTLQIKMAHYRSKKNNGDQSANQNSPPSNHSNSAIPDNNGSSSQKDGNISSYKANFNAEALDRESKGSVKGVHAAVHEEILVEKEQQIRELQETVEILELKIAKLEQLVRLKDNKIQKLMNK